MRKCTCDKCEIGSPFSSGQCRLCWLYHNDPRYQKLWGGTLEHAENFIKAVNKRAKDGFRDVDQESYKERLKQCESCDSKTEDWRCLECGCFLTIKAKWSTEDCPRNKWPLPTIESKKDGGCNCNKV
jgi:hypothetical protein